MRGCPFWSTTTDRQECYDECPMNAEHTENQGEHCIFKECELANKLNFKDILKGEFNLLDLLIYQD